MDQNDRITQPSANRRKYDMRDDFNGYEQSSVQYSEYVKVTRRLKQENGQLRVEQLSTKLDTKGEAASH
jgi:hypothetical protein